MTTPVIDPHASEPENFAEAALRLGGKSDEEVRKTGAVDRADDQVEGLFAPQYQTVNSPIHKIIWDQLDDLEGFQGAKVEPSAKCRQIMTDSLAVARRHRQQKSLLDDRRKLRPEVLSDLAQAGYWGMLVEEKYGGAGAPMSVFGPFLTQMATIDPTTAGLASVHGCIGAVDPLRAFGNDAQKQYWLPKLASGERLSAFALTEPGAGSDLTALRTKATLDGDSYVVDGEKLFITNAIYGRTIGLVCLIDDKPAVLIVDLPDGPSPQFELVDYGLHALKHAHNKGLRFRGLRVPKTSRLMPTRGDGLTIAYHGLNLGRVALCATAAGNLRVMMANMIPWANFRRTYGQTIATRELVRRRIGKLAGMMVACDALVAWTAALLDQGYRGEMECTIAKIYGSEAQKEAAIELFMKTHGGRSFLHGHLFGDNVHEFLAPCIYEGEGEMLGMAFFKSLVKEHGRRFFEPIGKILGAKQIKHPNPLNPAHAIALLPALLPYSKWWLGQTLMGPTRPKLPELPGELLDHVGFAIAGLQHIGLEISAAMRTHQLKLADRQCRMNELSSRVQSLVVMLVACLYAGRQDNDLIRRAAAVLSMNLRDQLTGQRPSDQYFKLVTQLGERIITGGFADVAGVDPEAIMMSYSD